MFQVIAVLIDDICCQIFSICEFCNKIRGRSLAIRPFNILGPYSTDDHILLGPQSRFCSLLQAISGTDELRSLADAYRTKVKASRNRAKAASTMVGMLFSDDYKSVVEAKSCNTNMAEAEDVQPSSQYTGSAVGQGRRVRADYGLMTKVPGAVDVHHAAVRKTPATDREDDRSAHQRGGGVNNSISPSEATDAARDKVVPVDGGDAGSANRRE